MMGTETATGARHAPRTDQTDRATPGPHPGWPALPAAESEVARRLADALADAPAWDAAIPEDIAAFKLRENLEELGEGAHATILGPMPPRGPATGLVIWRGRVAAAWGDPGRADIAFSVTKSALSTLAGAALADGLIPSLDGRVCDTVAIEAFEGDHNARVSWRHLLSLTSEWRGALWGIPDSIDWNRAVPKRPDAPPKGSPREIRSPGAYWEFNDVRVNLLALALTHVYGEGLESAFRRRIMDPIGASRDWAWNGYDGAEAVVGARTVPVVSGGAHWGGGLVIPAWDLARLALLHARRGRWGGEAVLPALWFDALRAPTPSNPSFGLMWWHNGAGAMPALSPAALWGSGIAHLLVADPEEDLVVVLRWYDVARRDELLSRIRAAIAGR